MGSDRSARQRPAYEVGAEDVVEPPLTAEDWRDLDRGADLFNGGAFWESHEAWEQVWRRCDTKARVFFQGLIQLAAAYHQRKRGVYHGVLKHFNNAQHKLSPFGDRFVGVDVVALCQKIEVGRRRVEFLGPDHLSEFEPELVPRVVFERDATDHTPYSGA